MQIKAADTLSIQVKERRRERALLSVLVPGFGQFAQRRFVTASIQFGTVAAYLSVALAADGRKVLILAVLWNAWSGIDAYRYEAD